jgi:rare lipoprotein A
MKRWLAALAVFAACACHVDIAAADTRPPTLWQRIVSVFAPQPALRHPAPKVVAAPKPAEASASAGSLPPVDRADGLALARQTDPAIAAMPVETLSAAPPATLEPRPTPVAPTKSARKHEQRDKAKSQLHADATGALPATPVQPEPVTALAEPPSATAPNAGATAFKPTKKVKHDQAGYQLASLGSPGLKAALAPETAQPETGPHAPEGAFPAAPSHGSVCNTGRKVMTAYYWEGSRTASGQPFNPHAMTAAHRSLPFGTRLNVTNPRTGKTVEVIVNDRGPYVSGVSLDLSLGAAQAIGLHGTGSVCIL